MGSEAGHQFDVAVIGGGPGGSSTATALARRGRRVLLLERDRFPRFHIGESQLPWINEVLEALGARETVAKAGFVEKWGASFWEIDGTPATYVDFTAAVETPMPQTFQVSRGRFDELLLRHAERSGVIVREGHRAIEAAFDADGVTLRYAGPDGQEHDARVAVLIDASGRAGFLARKIGRHEMDPRLQHVAVHAHYEGIPRPAGRPAGDIRVLTRRDVGWIWLIPISDTVTSVGVVVSRDVHRREARPTAEASLEHYLLETPAAPALMRQARRASAARYDADYSYLATRMAGDRWVAVGDAAAFLDPIFSTGVLLAMQGGLEAAEAIDAGLRAGDVSARRFRRYEQIVRRRYHYFRRFVIGFYDPYFRRLLFRRSRWLGIYEAVLSALAGNWRPTLGTRLRIGLFFALIGLKRALRVAPPGDAVWRGETTRFGRWGPRRR
ncbi:MAG TPA: NAD(P)/FAD-dependent oxidoreductase [Methylomirabilota bacterium]|nr:NAD(P)/FAD-dependent oxidoreductase [Methylomirabilota bacterium]